MIFGNHAILHIDGAEYIRVAELGQLGVIAEEMGMGLDARNTLDDAIDELHNRLKEQLYIEMKGRIP